MRQSVTTPGLLVLHLTATLAACVREAMASEIIEAGVVVGGMKEGGLMACHVRRETRLH